MIPSKYKPIAEEITDKIIAELQRGNLHWLRGWRISEAPRNGETGRLYTGGNIVLLRLAAIHNGWTDPRWFTWNGLQRLGAWVKKGEHHSPAIFWKTLPVTDDTHLDANGQPRTRLVPFMKTYQLYNADQCSGLPRWEAPSLSWQPIERAEAVCRAWPVRMQHAGNEAFYQPDDDTITLPNRAAFVSAEAFYGVWTHEIGHSTGHPSRLNRDVGPYGSLTYAKEEILGELFSAMMQQVVGVAGQIQNSAAYIASWLRVLEQDRRFILEGAAKAQDAVDLVERYDPYAMAEAQLPQEAA